VVRIDKEGIVMKSTLKAVRMVSVLSMILFALLLFSCGGGGGGDGETNGEPPQTGQSDQVSIAIIGLGDSVLTTNQSPITVSGVAGSDVGIKEVQFENETAGISAYATGTTKWSAKVDLLEGDNEIKFTAVANDNSQGEISTTITYYTDSTFTTPLEVSDNLMYIDEPKDVTFTIGIDSDSVDSVTLHETDRDGTPLSQVAILKDDGVLPDEIDKDGIYTTKKSLSSSEEGYLCYRVNVTEKDGDSYYSETSCVWITSHYTNEDIEKAVDLANSAKDIYEQAVGDGKSLQEAAETVVDQLKGDASIAEIATTDGSGVAWVTNVGILGGYHPTSYDQESSEENETVLAYNQNGYEATSIGEAFQAAEDEEKNEIKSNKAIIISPYIRHIPPDPNGDFGKKDNYFRSWPTIKNKNSCKLYAAGEVLNDVRIDVSLDTFKNLSDYGYIHICTHGFPYYKGIFNWWREDWGPQWPYLAQVGIYSGLVLPKKTDGTYDKTGYEEDLKTGRIAI